MKVPDAIECAVGWRVWAVDFAFGQMMLRSLLYRATTWPRGHAAVAECEFKGLLPKFDGPPCSSDHSCGIHAAKTVAGCATYFPRHLHEHHRFPVSKATQLVIGTVQLWGEVEEHELAYRAQYAYPLTIYVPVAFKVRHQPVYAADAVDMLERGYGREVRMFRRLVDLHEHELPAAA